MHEGNFCYLGVRSLTPQCMHGSCFISRAVVSDHMGLLFQTTVHVWNCFYLGVIVSDHSACVKVFFLSRVIVSDHSACVEFLLSWGHWLRPQCMCESFFISRVFVSDHSACMEFLLSWGRCLRPQCNCGSLYYLEGRFLRPQCICGSFCYLNGHCLRPQWVGNRCGWKLNHSPGVVWKAEWSGRRKGNTLCKA